MAEIILEQIEAFIQKVSVITKIPRSLILYTLIGGTGVVVDLSIFFILANKFGINSIISNSISSSVATIYTFIINAFFNFKTKKHNILLRFLSYYFIGLCGIGLSSLILYIFVNKLHEDKNIIKIISLFFVLALQYTLNKNISFKTSTFKYKN